MREILRYLCISAGLLFAGCSQETKRDAPVPANLITYDANGNGTLEGEELRYVSQEIDRLSLPRQRQTAEPSSIEKISQREYDSFVDSILEMEGYPPRIRPRACGSGRRPR